VPDEPPFEVYVGNLPYDIIQSDVEYIFQTVNLPVRRGKKGFYLKKSYTHYRTSTPTLPKRSRMYEWFEIVILINLKVQPLLNLKIVRVSL